MKPASTREKIARLAQSRPDLSAADMGRQLGVTRERARQLLTELGFAWRAEWKRIKVTPK